MWQSCLAILWHIVKSLQYYVVACRSKLKLKKIKNKKKTGKKDAGGWKWHILISSQNWLGLRICTGHKMNEVS